MVRLEMFALPSLFTFYCFDYVMFLSLQSGTQKAQLELVDLLIQTNLYDMAFTVLLRFFKGSELKRYMCILFTITCFFLYKHSM